MPIPFLDTVRPLRKIKIASISRNPYQPRKNFDKEAIDRLADSIRQYGVLNPLTVRRVDAGYELIAGERRLRASRAAGLSEVPCIVINADEEQSSAIALVENLQRRDLDFFEEAWGYKRLIELHGLTQEEAARRVGKTQSAVANKLRLLKLSPRNMQLIRDGNLTERHARSVLRLPDEERRLAATQYIIDHELNVSRSEQYIDKLLSEQETKVPERHITRFIKDVRFFLNTVDKAVGVMQQAGVDAKVEREEQDGELMLRILIPNVHSTK
ncbi:MAG: ParB/RepB/Spo0J family partition protein [Clostridia bacterium]|nr:ParB/RepB/Spo0J family partition protein [Clostridia bacterium]